MWSWFKGSELRECRATIHELERLLRESSMRIVRLEKEKRSLQRTVAGIKGGFARCKKYGMKFPEKGKRQVPLYYSNENLSETV